MDVKRFTSEQIERAKACETPEDILRLASEEGVELSDEEIEKVAGGGFWDDGGGSSEPCPFCGSTNTYEDVKDHGAPRPIMVCVDCGMTW